MRDTAGGEHGWKCQQKRGPQELLLLLLLLRGPEESEGRGKPSAPRVSCNSFVDETGFELNLKRKRLLGHFKLERSESKGGAVGSQVEFWDE